MLPADVNARRRGEQQDDMFPPPRLEPDRVLHVPVAWLEGVSTANAPEDLRESIRRVGMIYPIAVRESSSTVRDIDNDQHTVLSGYEIIDGSRRARAVIELGMTSIRAMIFPASVTRRQVATMRITSNLVRRQNIVSEARACRELARDGTAPQEIAERLSLPLRTVEQRLRIATLSDPLLGYIEWGVMSAATASALARMRPTLEEEASLANLIQSGEVRRLTRRIVMDRMRVLRPHEADTQIDAAENLGISAAEMRTAIDLIRRMTSEQRLSVGIRSEETEVDEPQPIANAAERLGVRRRRRRLEESDIPHAAITSLRLMRDDMPFSDAPNSMRRNDVRTELTISINRGLNPAEPAHIELIVEAMRRAVQRHAESYVFDSRHAANAAMGADAATEPNRRTGVIVQHHPSVNAFGVASGPVLAPSGMAGRLSTLPSSINVEEARRLQREAAARNRAAGSQSLRDVCLAAPRTLRNVGYMVEGAILRWPDIDDYSESERRILTMIVQDINGIMDRLHPYIEEVVTA